MICPTNNMLSNLVWGSWAENGADKARHGRAKGERHPNARLTRDQVVAIRADPRRQVDIAADYEISQAHVSDLKTGRRGAWAHI